MDSNIENPRDIVQRLRNRAALLEHDGLYVEASMNVEAANTIDQLRAELQHREELIDMMAKK